MDSSDDDSPEIETLDVSNDKHYQLIPSARIRNSIHEDFLEVPTYGSPTIRHSLPAYDLWRPFFPTHLSVEKFRNLHRPKLRHYTTGPRPVRHGKTKAFPIKNLSRQIYRAQKDLRNRIVRAINSGFSREEIVSKILSIRSARDLTAKKGEVYLFEYSEENPPVLSQIGMASNVKVYVRPNVSGSIRQVLTKSNQDNMGSSQKTTATSQEMTNNDQNSTSLKCECSIGVREILSDMKQQAKPIYFSPLKPGTNTMFIENNLYRAPIYPHHVDDCDFLVIRTRNNIYVRSFHKIFTVGQTMPLEIIPPPTDRAIQKFRNELSNLHLHQLFREKSKQGTGGPTINLEYLHRLFPDFHITILRRRMTSQGSLHVGNNLFHRGTSKYGLRTLKEDRSILKPEQYCLNMSTLYNRQRLRELNYLESMILPTDSVVLETEVLAAPWNTSKAINDTIMSRCYLDLKKHLIDPTGPRREGFSCVSWLKSPTEEEQKSQQKNSSNQAPSQPATIPSTNPMAFKIKREKLERLEIYKKEAQLITEVQSNVLGSHEVLSSDEGSDAEAEEEEGDILNSSFDQQVRDLDRLVVDGRTAAELNYEREEEERIGLMSMCNGSKEKEKDSSKTKAQDELSQYKNKVLKIFRTYRTDDGVMEVKTELVREPQIIAKYVQSKEASRPSPPGTSESGAGSALPTPETTASPIPHREISNRSIRRGSLGPSELCRTDGNKLIISKSVLVKNRRPRRCSRDSNNSSFYRDF